MSIAIKGKVGKFINNTKPFQDGSYNTTFSTGHPKLLYTKKADGKNDYAFHNFNYELSSKLFNYSKLKAYIVEGNDVVIEGYMKVRKGYTTADNKTYPDSDIIVVTNIISASQAIEQSPKQIQSNQSTQEAYPNDDLPF